MYEETYINDQGLSRFLADLLQKLPPGARVLDLSCGTGRPVAATLAAAGHHVTGIDASDIMVALARAWASSLGLDGGSDGGGGASSSSSFEVADVRTYEPLGADPRFDAVLSVLSPLDLMARGDEVHDDEGGVLVGRCARWLRPGGLLGVCRIAAEDLDPPVERRGGRWDEDGLCARNVAVRFMGGGDDDDDDEYTDATLLTREGWRVLLEAKGFALEETFTVRYTPPPLDSVGEPGEHSIILARLTGPAAQDSM